MKPRSVGLKLSVSAIAATALILVLAMAWVSTAMLRDARAAALRRMQDSVDSASALLTGYDDSYRKAALRDFASYKALFPKPFELVEATDAAGKPAPKLLHGGEPLNGNFALVDQFTVVTGSPATVFARAGDDFLRITTSVKKQDGTRAMGTLLGKQSPAYQDMIDGKTRVDRFALFGTTYMHVYEPIRQGNRTIGVLYIGVSMTDALARLRKTLQAQKLFDTGAIYAVEQRAGADYGTVFGLDNALKLDDKNPDAHAFLGALHDAERGELLLAASPRAGDAAPARPVQLAFAKNAAWNWVLVAEAPQSEIMAQTRGSLLLLWTSVALALLAMAGVTLWLSGRIIGRPVARLSEQLRHLAQGDLTRPLATDRRDELGQLTLAMEAFRSSLLQSMRQVHHNAEAVSHTAAQIVRSNQDLSQRTEQQAAALEHTGVSMSQLSTTVRQNDDTSRRASELASSARSVAAQGGDVVGEVVRTMKGINDSSKQISDIIGVIDGIAFQTNILALNAAVEAARAGEQGRGFAVVAGEVRSLAQRSADAARQIKALISASVGRVEEGAALVDRAGATMSDVVSSIAQVTDLMAQISTASHQQSAGVAQLGQSVAQMDLATQQNAALVDHSAQAAERLTTQAQQLVDAVAVFELGAAPAVPGGLDPAPRAPVASAHAPSRPHAPAPNRATVPAQAARHAPPAARAGAARPAAGGAAPRPVPARPVPAQPVTDDWETF